ncbi:hypothetical protein [Mycolicibacterium sp.]|uniref:hypothetical protein n=1 Tax=Mycolicibacterium sp. TaxID=2320850 RepID=UPI001A1B71F9|nr:hypothetical protein [Mycolicibacterium sp.]
MNTVTVVGKRTAALTVEYRREVDELNVCLRFPYCANQSGTAAGRAIASERIVGPRFPASEISQVEKAVAVGSWPVNFGRGFTAKRHPPSTPGVAQCVELFHQFRGQAVNPVGGAPIALALDIGSPTAVSVVTTLEGPVTNGG